MLFAFSQDEALIHYSTYTEEQVVPVAKIMLDYLARPVVHDCFYKKYGCKKYLKGTHSRCYSAWPSQNLGTQECSRGK